eukprot:TRINITY_DN43119_c0_g1_i1.p1 TRINITY_DN43119_c0_g1~~TRINITY_DN43119_c0_g1_i1.p1  ORF type:complete len:341 (+),score=59.08 TRINITY_DN43119_c0_g1_i1:128-1150(+)
MFGIKAPEPQASPKYAPVPTSSGASGGAAAKAAPGAIRPPPGAAPGAARPPPGVAPGAAAPQGAQTSGFTPGGSAPPTATEQTQPLLSDRPQAAFYGPPSQTFHGGGAREINMLSIFLFASSASLALGSLLNLVANVFALKLANATYLSFLSIISCSMALLDSPFFTSATQIKDTKFLVGKYANILTRLMGKGIAFVWLGLSLLGVTWDTPHGVFTVMLMFIITAFAVLVGFATILYGWSKTQRLFRSQMLLRHGILENRFRAFAQSYGPHVGLTMSEFNGLTTENGGYAWDDPDLLMIFRALLSNPSRRVTATNKAMDAQTTIPLEDMKSWVYGSMVWL